MTSRLILKLLPILFFSPAIASACTCSKAPPGICPGLQSDDVVFTGTVTAIENVSPAAASEANTTDSESAAPAVPASDATPIIRYHFKIDEKFAGPDTAEIDVFSGGDDGDCGYRFQKGRPVYRLHATGNGRPPIRHDLQWHAPRERWPRC